VTLGLDDLSVDLRLVIFEDDSVFLRGGRGVFIP
jgi:hypothetical protein